MSFGLTNALATFKGYINKIFMAEKLDIFVIVYLNDILIYTSSKRKKHVEAILWMLEQLKKYLLYVNHKKCEFHQEDVRLFGYIVSYQDI